MWIKSANRLVNSNSIAVLSNWNGKKAVQVAPSAVFEYQTLEDCEFVLSLIAKAIQKGDKVFEMPTQEDVTNRIVTGAETATKQKACMSIKEALEMWNNLAEYGYKPVSRVSVSSERGKLLNARLNEYSKEEWEKAIENIRNSNLLKDNQKKWFNFDWFIGSVSHVRHVKKLAKSFRYFFSGRACTYKGT